VGSDARASVPAAVSSAAVPRVERRSTSRPWSKAPAAKPAAPKVVAAGNDTEWNEF
jgi:hypothetical protein